MSQQRRRVTTLGSRVAPAESRTAVMQPGSWRTTEMSSTQRGYGYRWQKERAAYLRVHPFCVYCLREQRILATAIADIVIECAARGLMLPYGNLVDHIIAHRGDVTLFWDQANWQTLCGPHHSREKQREENAG